MSAKKTTKKPLAKKSAAKKAPAKTTAAKKVVARKAPAKKTVAKKAPAKKTAVAKKAVAKKAPAKKVVAKKAPAKKVVAKKAPAKKIVAKKAPAKKVVARKAPAKKIVAAKKPAVPVVTSLGFGAGKTVACEIADFDACDIYTFHVQITEPALVAAWKLKGCPDWGMTEVTPNGLAEGTSVQVFSQGNDGPGDLPPFLLSRDTFAALSRGEPTKITFGEETSEFRPDGHEERQIVLDEGPVLVRCLRARGDDGDLWVVDDPTWPLIARIESAGGDNYSEIKLISAHEPAAVEEQLSKK